MDDELHPALLPAGLRDVLPPDAAVEAEVVHRLMTFLDLHGYERVKPPLVEFEASLLSGAGAGMAPDTFRMMDPVSHRMIGIRADMTMQIARIATARLGRSARPLRLSYAGQVLRVSASELRPERQFGQVGAELIGCESASADAEIVTIAADALSSLGARALTIDLTVPPLVPAILAALGIGAEPARKLRQALDHKDPEAVSAIGSPAAAILSNLMVMAGPAHRSIEQLSAIDLPETARPELDRLRETVSRVTAALPDLHLTIDPVENRGFEYHTGVSFTIFSAGVRGELGRGGRYRAGTPSAAEPSTGFTLYTDTLLRAVDAPAAKPRLYLPVDTTRATGAELRRAGWVTVAALAEDNSVAEDARRLGCTHILGDTGPVPL